MSGPEAAVYTAPEVLRDEKQTLKNSYEMVFINQLPNQEPFLRIQWLMSRWLINAAQSNNYESSCVQTDQTNYEHY